MMWSYCIVSNIPHSINKMWSIFGREETTVGVFLVVGLDEDEAAILLNKLQRDLGILALMGEENAKANDWIDSICRMRTM